MEFIDLEKNEKNQNFTKNDKKEDKDDYLSYSGT